MSLIRISNLFFAYDKTPIFQDLNLEIEEGILCGILGPNGAGKSTFLKLLAGQLHPTAGQIIIANKEIHSGISKSHADLIATVPQESSLIYGYTVSEIVMMARFFRKKRVLFEHPDDWKAIEEALRETGISPLSDRPINQLSGGERQRVYLARALAQDTPVLLLDEPASHLDMKHQVLVYDLLKRLRKDRRKTIIMVTHDLNLAAQYCDMVVLLGQNGKIVHGPVQQILNEQTVKSIFDTDCHVITYERFNFFVPKGTQPA
jgi:iron complex transport system ATP-binding protein